MINCKKCNFKVLENMKYALMNNLCPSCGQPLFSDSDMNQITFLQSKIASQKFGKKLNEFTIYDITIFMLSEMRKMKKTIVEQERARYNNTEGNVLVPNDEEVVTEEEPITWEEDAGPIVVVPEQPEEIEAPLSKAEKIRLKQEMLAQYAQVDPEVEDSAFEDSGDDKVDRLKRIASKHRANKSGPIVSRVDR